MRNFHTISILIITIVCIIGCKSASHIEGTYLSRFAEARYFSTLLMLRSDSSVVYLRTGHFQYDSVGGKYKLRGNKLYLLLERDTVTGPLLPTYREKLKFDTVKEMAIPFHHSYIRKPGKLLVIEPETGKIKKRSWGFLKTRKYLLFGPQYFRRRFFLENIR